MKKKVSLGLVVGLLVLAIAGTAYYRSAYIGDHVRVRRLLFRINNHCNRVRTYLEAIQRDDREGRRELAGNMYAVIESQVSECAHDPEAAKKANGDIDKLLEQVPLRDLDDSELADRVSDLGGEVP